MTRLLAAAVLSSSLTACATLDYYAQAIGGHLDLMVKRRAIDSVLDDPATEPSVRERLRRVERMRSFAEQQLALSPGRSYRTYVDTGRRYVTWTVVAAPALALTPKTWCFPVVGCLSYRGYFARARAERLAAQLADEGFDVHVAGARAYSTLGWFDDPVLNTMLGREASQLAGILFHELAHQRLYVKGDSTFSESYAVAVEREGIRRWLGERDDRAAVERHERWFERHDAVLELIARAREELDSVYSSDGADHWKRTEKQRIFAALRERHDGLKARWGGVSPFDRWFASELNNARLASLATYHELVPAFEKLLRTHVGDMRAFHEASEAMAALPPDARRQALHELLLE